MSLAERQFGRSVQAQRPPLAEVVQQRSKDLRHPRHPRHPRWVVET